MQHDNPHVETSDRPKLTRSKAGCQTCREKRVKCGEEKPCCEQCRMAKRLCTYQAGTKTIKAEKMRSLQPRDSPIAIRPKTAAKIISPIHTYVSISPDHNYSTRKLSADHSFVHGAQILPRRGSGGQKSWQNDTTAQSPSGGTFQHDPLFATPSLSTTIPAFASNVRQLPDVSTLTASHSGPRSHDVPAPNPHTSIHAFDSNQTFKLEFDCKNDESQIANAMISVPSTLSLSQYCFVSSSATSTPISFLRNTYLARLTTGAYLLAESRFASVVAPILDELDPNSQMKIIDPLRLHNTFSNSCFQEAYVLSLRESLHTPIHSIRVWWSALFLLVMSLELGMFSAADFHLSEALACVVQSDVRQLLRTGMPDHYAQLLLFLTESTYRYASMIGLVKGSQPYAITKDDLLEVKHPPDVVLRTTTALRIKVIDILYVLVRPTESKLERDRAEKGVDAVLWEIYEIERLQQEHAGGQTQDLQADGPFGYKAFSSPDWAHASLALIFTKLLLSNVVNQLRRRELLQEYFAILGHLILVSQQKCTLDLMATSLTVVMLDDPLERRWAMEALRTGVCRGCSLLIPLEVFEKCVIYIWQSVDAKPVQGLHKDWELIRTLQYAFREAL